MSNDLNRRKILKGLGAATAGGLAVGASANALFLDSEFWMGNLFQSGEFELQAAWNNTTNTALTLDTSSGDSSGSSILTLQIPEGESNPGWLWFRPRCPDPQNDFAGDIHVALYYDVTNELIAEGNLCEFATALRSGIAIDGAPSTEGVDCLSAGDTVNLRLDWSYGGAGSGPATFPIDIHAEQCRHNEDPPNPFTPTPICECPQYHGISNIQIYTCSSTGDPEFLGKISLDDSITCDGTDGISDNYIEVGTYPLYVDDDCEPTGYEVDVESISTKSGGSEITAIEFAVYGLDDTPDPELCKVDISGAGETVTYERPDSLEGNHTIGELEAPEL